MSARPFFSFQRFFICMLVIVPLSLGALGCGGGGAAGDDDDDDDNGGNTDLGEATAATVTGTTVDDAFLTNGQFTIAFTATDANSIAILCATATTNTDVTCAVTGQTCTLSGVRSTQPSGGAGTIVAAVDLDSSGSMSTSDPGNDRVTAAKSFLDEVCGNTSDFFGVFDFGNGSNLSFSDTRDLLTANSATVTGTLPYVQCSADNVTVAKAAIDAQVTASGMTPLYDSLVELCNDMATNSTITGRSAAIMVLSDGADTASGTSTKTDVETCVNNNSITLCTVGLGPGSSLGCDCSANADCTAIFSGDTCNTTTSKCESSTNACTADADCASVFSSTGSCNTTTGRCVMCSATYGNDTTLVGILQDFAEAGNCTYAAATDPSALQPIFDAIATRP